MFDKFKKSLNIIPNKNWDDITIGMFENINDILQNRDDYTTLNLIQIIWNIDTADIKACDIQKYVKKLDFIAKEPKQKNPKTNYTINGTKYICDYKITDMSAAQFFDFQNYSANNKLEELLSVFIIPEGHSYNDGYDINKTKADLLELPITEAIAAAFFFKK